jgi:hypothetical protein
LGNFDLSTSKLLKWQERYTAAAATASTANSNAVKIFIIYAPIQQVQAQLQTKHNVDTGNYIMDRYNIKSKTNYRQALETETH